MSRRLRRFAVVLVIISFVLIALHSYLLNEKPSDRASCPLCQWLHNLAEGEPPAVAVVGVQILGDASPEPAPVLSENPYRAPLSARSPPSA